MLLDKKDDKKIAFIVQLPLRVSPGQRFRFENWVFSLHQNSFEVEIFPFLDDATYKILYMPGFILKKILGTAKGFIKRFFLLFKLFKYDFIFLQREVAPIGPPIFEWIIAKILKKKIIYDFDDAIWIKPEQNRIFSFLKCYWKIKFICKWSYKVAVGNQYLAAFARNYNRNVIVLPTVVDTINQHNKLKTHLEKEVTSIGWTGSHSTLVYLKLIEPALIKLQSIIPFRFIIIADKMPDLALSNIEFIKWNENTEIDDLLKIDIGIMPLRDDAWSSGKCGFKLIQYLSLGIPAVASPVGVNTEIIKPLETGFLCTNDMEWQNALEKLLNECALRTLMGKNGRVLIENFYSIESQEKVFLSLFY